MSVGAADLNGVGSLTGLLARLPQGRPAQELAKRLGLWSPALHRSDVSWGERKFPDKISHLADTEISDLNAYWNSEVFRATELLGLVEGQRAMLSLELKQLEATTRARLRRQAMAAAKEVTPEGKPVKVPATTQLNDEVAEDARVQEQEQVLALLAVVLGSAKAYKEACVAACAAISREISFRQAQLGARLR